MIDSIETNYLSREEITQLENALVNADERTKRSLNKCIKIYNKSLDKCLEDPNKQSVNFLRYYLKCGQVPFINFEKREIKI